MWENVEVKESGNVTKFIFTQDDAIAEAVLYRYPTFEERTVMCISTQSGCQMGCTFCGTGKFFVRDLNWDEIIYQVSYMAKHYSISLNDVEKLQIMVMSMGEGVNNAYELSRAFNYLYNHYPRAQLLISTAAPKTESGWRQVMYTAETISTVGLQFSVHASTDEERNKIMPMKAKLTLEEIAYKGLEFYQRTGRKPYFNYCVTDKNNTQEDMHRLRMLFDPRVWEATLSVVCESDQSMAEAMQSQEEMVTEFSNGLVELGFNTRVFNPAGQDTIGSGCGQLWSTQQWVQSNSDKAQISAGHRIHIKNLEA